MRSARDALVRAAIRAAVSRRGPVAHRALGARLARAAACSLFAAACGGVEAPEGTGGVSVPALPGCGRGIVVVGSDYQSTNVSLIDFDGRTLSGSFVSSASARPGLSAALSGDVVVPSQLAARDLVLIDRYPTGVLTWIDLETAVPRAQLDVGTGFIANPHDYAELARDKAYVTRFETNFDPGREAFDAGDDVLIVDPSEPAIVGRIDLSPAFDEPEEYSARPDRLLLVEQRLLVLLGGYSEDFMTAAPARLATIDTETDAVDGVVVLDGARGCSALALSPGGDKVAVACAGTFGGDSISSLEDSAVVVVDVSDGLNVVGRYPASSLGGQPVGWGIDFVSDERLLAVTWGHLAEDGSAARVDQAFEVELSSGAAHELVRTEETPFALGEVRCVPACGACFVADAERDGGVVQRFPIDADGRLGAPSALTVERAIGLPPRYLGRF